MSFEARDLAGYRGKEIEVRVCQDVSADPGSDGGDQAFSQIRGAQSFNTTEERPSPDLIAEMGYETTKAIYGPVSYSLAVELLIRDLVQVARLSGIDPTTAKRLNVSEFVKTNAVAWFRDPDEGTISITKIACGFKARTASTPMAVGANATVTLDGAVDLASTFDGKANVVQYVNEAGETSDNGRNNLFPVPQYGAATPTATEVLQVENGEGVLAADADWSIDSAGDLSFDTTPEENAVIRIVYMIAQ